MGKFICKLSRKLLLPAVFIIFVPYIALAKQAMVNRIEVQHNPLAVKIFVTQPVPFKLIQVEKKELLVALKNVKLANGFKIKGKYKPEIKNIALETLKGDVMAVVLSGRRPYEYIKSGFNTSDLSFFINLEKKDNTKGIVKKSVEKPPVNPPVVKVPQAKGSQNSKKKQIVKNPISVSLQKTADGKVLQKTADITQVPVYVPPKREKSEYKGSIADLIIFIEKTQCSSKKVADVIFLLKQGLHGEAVKVLDQYVSQQNFACPEPVAFLNAYAHYLGAKRNDFVQLMETQERFQDAVVSYPDSPLVPYGYAAIGMIQKKMNNIAAAEGYFDLVKQKYPEYSGLAEILYHLADIYESKGYADKALRYYKNVFEDSKENNYIPDAGIGYGEELFNKKQYFNTLQVLDYVVSSYPRKVYASHELLLNIGNANFEVGRSKEARQNLLRVLNLFPEIDEKDVVLSKIGDTYGMENNREKAIKVYELVREKFPDSEGYIASSIGIARYLDDEQKKIEIYEMVKKKFPENKFARISMMRIAEIYQANGEYDKCIKEIEDLLAMHPKGLRYEAVKLMQRAYEALFKTQLKSDEYTKVLNRYELEHVKIEKMGSADIALSVGLAYLKAKLYEESFNHLINAYKQYKRSSRSPKLLFGLGVSMDESGRDDDALAMFASFSKRFPKNIDRVYALLRSGNIYFERQKYSLSSKKFDEAYKVSKTNLEKGRILILNSNVYEKKGDFKKTVDLREKAVKEFALAPGKNYDLLTNAYKQLGGTYRSLKNYVKSADAYSKALSFSEDGREKANLGFLLGDAYQKGNIITKAKAAFEQVISSDDSIWSSLAQQRLNTMELAEMVQNS